MKINIENHFLIDKYKETLEKITNERYSWYLKKGHKKSFDEIKNDFERGFLGEICAYEFLKQNKINVSEPNFEVYKKFEKNAYPWDLSSDNQNFSVKTCFIDNRPWSFSCNFDKKDVLRNFELNDWFILVGLADNLKEGDVLVLCPMEEIKVFLDVTLYPNFRDIKLALYLKEKYLKDLKRNTKRFNNCKIKDSINKLTGLK